MGANLCLRHVLNCKMEFAESLEVESHSGRPLSAFTEYIVTAGENLIDGDACYTVAELCQIPRHDYPFLYPKPLNGHFGKTVNVAFHRGMHCLLR